MPGGMCCGSVVPLNIGAGIDQNPLTLNLDDAFESVNFVPICCTVDDKDLVSLSCSLINLFNSFLDAFDSLIEPKLLVLISLFFSTIALLI